MDISRTEQRVLHLLAQGGRIEIEKNEKKRIASVKCLTREGWHYPGVDLDLFRKLKRKKAVSSSGGGPYRITGAGSSSSAPSSTTGRSQVPPAGIPAGGFLSDQIKPWRYRP